MKLRYLLVPILFSLISGTSTYTFKDAKNWGRHFPGCNGKNQSPMAEDEDSVVSDTPTIKEKLKFTDSEKLPKKVIMKNTGRTVELRGDWSGKPPRLAGGPLNGTYIFEKISFRWGPTDWTDAVDYDHQFESLYMHHMEMHLYFYKEDFQSFAKAESKKDGLAAFQLLNMYFEENTLLKDFEKNIHKVRSINATAELHPIPLASFAYRNESQGSLQSLFYKGSIDYPPCSESVTWFEPLFDVVIPENLLKEFRKIKLEGGDVSNVRPLQPINKRRRESIYSSEGNDI